MTWTELDLSPNGENPVDDDRAAGLVQVLMSIDARLAAIESKITEYEPLIELVRQRADRGTLWRRRNATGGNE